MQKRTVIVTGASSGIGKELAIGLAEKIKPEEIWAVARDLGRLEALKELLSVPVRPISADLTTPEGLSALRALLEQERPVVEVLVNASGFGIFERVDKIPEKDNLGMVDLNCRALTAMTQMVFPYLHAKSCVVNLASMAAFEPIPYGSVYAATKAYVLSFSRALAREWKQLDIKVLAVCPYWTKTAFIDRSNKHGVIGNFEVMYEPAFIAKKTLSAMDKRRDYVVPGAYAKLTHALTKILPHSLVMRVFMRRQKLK